MRKNMKRPFQKIVRNKYKSISGYKAVRKQKTISYLMGGGFESDLIRSAPLSIPDGEE
ncbi:MAG: hypothetical protein ACKO6Q_04780 [Bacteroidota bacterium]